MKIIKIWFDNDYLYGVDRPEGLWVSKIKTYKEEGMSYNQIWCVMDYIVRILGKKPDEFTIMAIPSYYNSTKKLYESKWRFDTSLEKLPKTLTIQKIKVDKSNIIKPNLNNFHLLPPFQNTFAIAIQI